MTHLPGETCLMFTFGVGRIRAPWVKDELLASSSPGGTNQGRRNGETDDRSRARRVGGRVQLERCRVRVAEPGLHRPRADEPATRAGVRRRVRLVVPRSTHEWTGRTGRALLWRVRHHERGNRWR